MKYNHPNVTSFAYYPSHSSKKKASPNIFNLKKNEAKAKKCSLS